jgi:hypothetical protein
MKTVTVSTILALLVAIPFIFVKRHPKPVELLLTNREGLTDENLRYDIDDFLTM